ncbi:MAG TPA: amidohydrolase family protein [Candidatus Kryptonia bacterium]
MNSTKILTGAYVFTCNDEMQSGLYNVLVRSNLVGEVSKDIELLRRKYPEAEIVDTAGKILLPAFFNAHYHPEAIICRFIEPRRPVSQWRDEYLLKVESVLDAQPESFYEKMYHLAFFGLLQSGVCGIAFSIIGDEAGARGMFSAVKLTGIEAVAFAESESQSAFLKKAVDSHLKIGLFVPYQKDLTLFGISAVSRTNSDAPGWILSHIDEDSEDVQTTKTNFNANLIQLLKRSGLLRAATFLVGMNDTPPNSLKIARNASAKIILVPSRLNAQSYRTIRNVFDKYAIGSDWETPGLFGQMRKLLEFGCPPEEALASTTRVSAGMFNMGSRLGSIETGKLANLSFVDAKKISARRLSKLPHKEAISALLEDYSDSDVSDVMVEGEFVYKDRKLLIFSESDLMREHNELTEVLNKYKEQTMVSESKSYSPKVPQTRGENLSELDDEAQKIELPKNTRKVFGEDEI